MSDTRCGGSAVAIDDGQLVHALWTVRERKEDVRHAALPEPGDRRVPAERLRRAGTIRDTG